MLTYINIKNFAIVKDLELDLHSEMTAITGETGAGKSIIIDSVELALGARADASLVRSGSERCEITLMFDLANIPGARNWLMEHDLDSEDECIIRRIISNEGRSKGSINGVSCTQQTLRKLSDFLLSIHGQHENQALLNSDYQRELLDAYALNKDLVCEVKKLYKSWLKAKKDLMDLENLVADHHSKTDFLNYQLEELETIDFSKENLENLRCSQKRLNNAEQFSITIDYVLNLISENDDAAIINNLYRAKNKLESSQSISPELVEPMIELVNNAVIQVEEVALSLRQNLNSLEYDENERGQIEDEMSKIHQVARKHQVDPEELLEVQKNFSQELEEIENAALRLEQGKVLVDEAEDLYLKDAKHLGLKRKLAATKLNELVSEKMQHLGMVGGRFAAKLTPNANQTFGANGLEKVGFLVSANEGLPLQCLNKVASGGELSRMSLAIQVITAEKEVTPTLIFDEIDTGIGGKTADMVGRLLRKLSQNTQVICITHLAQIASQGHNHISVAKKSTHKRPEINLTTLDRKERIEEIARMLGGVKISNQTLLSAEEMLNSVL